MKIPLKKTCSLSRYGYVMAKSKDKRQKSLNKAIASYSSRYVIQKLVVLRTYRKSRKTPRLKREWNKIDRDIMYVQKKRDSMSPKNRARDLKRSREYTKKNAANKMYCKKHNK